MLNLSDNRVELDAYQQDYDSLKDITHDAKPIKKLRVFGIVLLIIIGCMFLPWTQNVRAPGRVTTMYPEQRPQTIQSVIPGRIEKWYVREGQLVQTGDTIIQITEIKDEYFDPKLVGRTSDQIESKKNAAINYNQKAEALADQIGALEKNRVNKLDQASNKLKVSRLKVISDSIDYQAAIVDNQIAENRVKRMEELYEQGLKSLTDLESRRLKIQEARAKMISAENKLLTSRNELINAQIELSAVDNEYAEKLGKAKSDRNSALSTFYDTEAEISKMENKLSNVRVRQSYYFIVAQRDGYVTKTISQGIGETIKEGAEIVSIMPDEYDLTAEIFIDPVDYPLIKVGQTARLIFDGWPAIVFSGWPSLSNGTFGAEVWAIDNFISDNGKYRVLMKPNDTTVEWPEDLRVGSGADGILLLRDVSVWYELWRQLNGFPPDYYTNLEKDAKVIDDEPAIQRKK